MRMPLPEPYHDEPNPWLVEARSRAMTCHVAETLFEHVGLVDSSVMDLFLNMADGCDRLAFDGVMMRKRVVNIALEAMENVRLYALPDERAMPFVHLVGDAMGYNLQCGNVVPSATAVLLLHRLGIINEMPQEDLREHYKRVLGFDGRSREGGAGLGLITMARRASGPLVGRVAQLDDERAFFTLSIRTDRDQAVVAA